MTASSHPASAPRLSAGLRSYLSILGYQSPPPPTWESLVELHHGHLATVPYENLGIMLGRPPSVEVDATLDRLASQGLAGYCFHHNGVFAALLEALGFSIELRHGHVYSGAEDRADHSLNHLVIVVAALPTDSNPTGRWWADVGLGEGFVDPLPLVDGEHRQGVFCYRLSDVTEDGWSFLHTPEGSFDGVEISHRPLDISAAHREVASSTPFTRFLVVQRRDATGWDTLRGCMLQRSGPAPERTELTTYDDWRAALADRFGLRLDHVDQDELDALWEHTLAAHRTWVEAGRP